MNRPYAVFVWSLLSIITFTTSSIAQEWTRFRGPNGQGQSDATTIPDKWTESDYNWKVKLSGKGHSSPVIWGDKIFLTSAEDSGARMVVCLSTKDGSKVWEKKYPAGTSHIHQQNSFASSTPALDKSHVYAAWSTAEEITLVALTHDGKEVWKQNLGPFDSKHGFGTSPMVYEDLVIIANEQEGKSFLVAVNCKDGKDRWRIPQERAKGDQNTSYSTPTVYQPEKGPAELIVNTWGQGMTSVDPKSGKSNWEVTKMFPLRPIGCPVLAGGLIWGNCGEGGGNNTVFAVKPGTKGGAQPQVAYKFDRSLAPYVPSLVIHGKLVFLLSEKGLASCINAESGEKIYAAERVGGRFSGSPIRVKDRFYAISDEGDVFVLNAGEKYEVISKNPLGELARSTPAVSDGVMYLRTESQLFSLGKKSGAE